MSEAVSSPMGWKLHLEAELVEATKIYQRAKNAYNESIADKESKTYIAQRKKAFEEAQTQIRYLTTALKWLLIGMNLPHEHIATLDW